MRWIPRLRRASADDTGSPVRQQPPELPASATEESPADAPLAPAGRDVRSAARPGFNERGRLRRRLQFLRRAHELALRDLGGLVYELHRAKRERDDLVQAKLGTLARIDREASSLELALNDHRAVTELREPGITACPNCGAVHGSDARFCPDCGTAVKQPPGAPGAPVAGTPTGLLTTPDAGKDHPPKANPAPASPAAPGEAQVHASTR
jgi:hypothetical protein